MNLDIWRRVESKHPCFNKDVAGTAISVFAEAVLMEFQNAVDEAALLRELQSEKRWMTILESIVEGLK